MTRFEDLALFVACYGPGLGSALGGRGEAWVYKRLRLDPAFRALCNAAADGLAQASPWGNWYRYRPNPLAVALKEEVTV